MHSSMFDESERIFAGRSFVAMTDERRLKGVLSCLKITCCATTCIGKERHIVVEDGLMMCSGVLVNRTKSGKLLDIEKHTGFSSFEVFKYILNVASKEARVEKDAK